MSAAKTLAIHAVERCSRANGPGRRFVVWVQGCDLGCPGCYNPETHASGGAPWTASQLVDDMIACGDSIEGVSISGGEPLQQPAALLALVQEIRRRTSLSILLFSGYRRAEIEAMELGADVLGIIDVLIDGRYQHRQRHAQGLRGSANQRIHTLTGRYSDDDVAATPASEIKITAAGEVVITGVDPLPRPD